MLIIATTGRGWKWLGSAPGVTVNAIENQHDSGRDRARPAGAERGEGGQVEPARGAARRAGAVKAPLGGDAQGVLFKDYCWAEWQAEYGYKPTWRDKEFKQLHDALSRFEDEETARMAWSIFMKCKDEFFKGHSPGKFLVDLGRWMPKRRNRTQAQEQGELAARAIRMAKIAAEVDADPAVPRGARKDEYKRRWDADKGLDTPPQK